MAFKPITVTQEINGIEFTAQFNGMSARNEMGYIANEDMRKATPYLFENVLVTPKITDIDEYFGIDVDFYDKVTAFLVGVATADKKYFPDTNKETVAGKSKK